MYKVIASSSKGNAYLVHNEILIDVGVSYKILAPYLKDAKLILLTHAHSDHFKTDVISRIAMLHPNIIFIAGSWLEESLIRLNVGNYIILEPNGKWLSLLGYLIYPVIAYHGDQKGEVYNYGYRIVKGNHKTFHMTDTGSYEGINAKGYDILAIEANHDSNLINERLELARQDGRYEHGYYSKIYHASIQKAHKFVEENRKEDTQVIYLHQSDTYLSEEQHNEIVKMQQGAT